jgi:hypothetical protein
MKAAKIIKTLIGITILAMLALTSCKKEDDIHGAPIATETVKSIKYEWTDTLLYLYVSVSTSPHAQWQTRVLQDGAYDLQTIFADSLRSGDVVVFRGITRQSFFVLTQIPSYSSSVVDTLYEQDFSVEVTVQ